MRKSWYRLVVGLEMIVGRGLVILGMVLRRLEGSVVVKWL